MRKYGRKDANHNEIARAFESLGFSVSDTSSMGDGFPDIVVGKLGETYLFEIKDGKKFESKKKLTKEEEKFFKSWRGHIDIIENIDQVVEFAKKVNARNFLKLGNNLV